MISLLFDGSISDFDSSVLQLHGRWRFVLGVNKVNLISIQSYSEYFVSSSYALGSEPWMHDSYTVRFAAPSPVTHYSSQLESTGSSPLLPTTLESTINNYLVPVSSITVDMFFITLEYVATTTPHSRLATKLENESRWPKAMGHAQGHCIRVFTECCLFIFPSISSNIELLLQLVLSVKVSTTFSFLLFS